MKVLLIDGQGGKIGKSVVEKIKILQLDCEIYAIGTNSIATSTMLKAGADYGATGENPVIVNCKDANIIVGPIGIVIANSLMGEITPKMAISVGKSKAYKILLPINKCNNYIVGVQEVSSSEIIDFAVNHIKQFIYKNKSNNAL